MAYSPWQFPHYSYFGVSGDTLVMTRDQGNVAISTLFAVPGQAIEAWNGTGWEQTSVGSAGVNQPLYLVTLSNGATLTVSGGYNWYTTVIAPQAPVAQGSVISAHNAPAPTPSPVYPTYYGVKSSLIAPGASVWRTETETDPYGASGFPTVTSVVPTGSSADLFYVASSSGLTLYNNVLASCGYAPEDGSGEAPPSTPPPPVVTSDPVAPDRSFNPNNPLPNPEDPWDVGANPSNPNPPGVSSPSNPTSPYPTPG